MAGTISNRRANTCVHDCCAERTRTKKREITLSTGFKRFSSSFTLFSRSPWFSFIAFFVNVLPTAPCILLLQRWRETILFSMSTEQQDTQSMHQFGAFYHEAVLCSFLYGASLYVHRDSMWNYIYVKWCSASALQLLRKCTHCTVFFRCCAVSSRPSFIHQEMWWKIHAKRK